MSGGRFVFREALILFVAAVLITAGYILFMMYRESVRDYIRLGWGPSETHVPLYERGSSTAFNYARFINTNDATVCSNNPDVLVYNRINKAGSTTTMDIIKRLSKMNNFTILTPMPYHDHKKLRNALFRAIESGKRTVIMNHFDFPEFMYSSKVAYINMMRDPVERFISEYYYLRAPRRGRLSEEYRAEHGNLSLEECIFGESKYTGNCLGEFNVMAHYFCGMESSLCHTNDTQLREFSRLHLDSVYTVGVIENLQESLRMLEKQFPKFFKNAPSLAIHLKNENGGGSRQESQKVLSYLTDMHQIDYSLYERAKVKLKRYIEDCVD